MLPTIPSGNVASALPTGYDVDNSCRFDGSSAYMSKTMGTATNRLKLTMSVWLKRSTLGASVFFSSYYTANWRFQFYFDGSDRLAVLNIDNTTTNVSLITNRVFRDVSAYYHVQAVIDTTEASSSNRVKLYVNGTQETSFATSTYPAENADMSLGASSYTANIGRYGGASDYFSGYMSEFVYLDGQTLAPTSFGEFDDDSPTIWKPIEISGLTFGDEGIFLDFKDSGNLGDDESGNGHDFTETNLAATDQTVDTPTNNFCTINPLDYYPTVPSDLEGNTVYNKSSTGDTHNSFANCTMGVTAGKWYYELKVGDGNAFMVGWVKTPHGAPDAAGAYASDSGLYVVKNAGEKIVAGSESGSAWNTVTTNDIIGLAYDFDNLKFYISKNGTWENSGDPTSGATGTGSFGNIAAGTYVPMIGNANYNATSLHYFNFGNPAYSLSSAVNDANGYGNFEYAVPSGYLALCTKNLGSDGG